MNAYIHYLGNDNDYQGVIHNIWRLRKLGSNKTHICICCSDVSEEVYSLLHESGAKIMKSDLNNIIQGLKEPLKRHLISKHFFGKFLMFCVPNEYTKCVYLDADFMILQNLDNLFEEYEPDLKNMYMVPDCVMTPPNTICYIENAFNSGLVIFKPNREILRYAYEVALKKQEEDVEKAINLFVTDQEFFNHLNYINKIHIRPIPFKYNAYPYVVESLVSRNIEENIAVIHYISRPKPWDLMNLSVKLRAYETDMCRKLYMMWIQSYCNMITEKRFEERNTYLLKPECSFVMVKRSENYLKLEGEGEHIFVRELK